MATSQMENNKKGLYYSVHITVKYLSFGVDNQNWLIATTSSYHKTFSNYFAIYVQVNSSEGSFA